MLRAGLSTIFMTLASYAWANEAVSIDVSALKDTVTFCIRANPDHKISAQYGIEFRGEAPKLWNETFPKVVAGEGIYFETPLRIDLRRHGDVGGTTMHVRLGACTKSISKCNLLDFRVRVPSGQQPVNCS